MAGFVTAAALVRPSRSVMDLEPSSVLKRMKDKAFARAVSRDDLKQGAMELELPLEEHVGNVITFLRERADVLGLGTPNDSNGSNDSNDSNDSNV
jgi:predicted hydrolase (HD superfamily)